MPNERSNVRFPLWRKKMDGSMFGDQCTVIPNWVVDNVFNIRGRFSKREKSDPLSQAHVSINRGGGKRTTHAATVTTSPRGGIPVMRLYFGDDVTSWLMDVFRMTYARYQERLKHDINGPTIEKLIPFWEFIDIEWDETASTFHFTAWYTQNEITHTKPGQPLQELPDQESTTSESGEDNPAEDIDGLPTFGETDMQECLDLCISDMELTLDGKEGRFRWYALDEDITLHLKYSKYYEVHDNFWFAVTPHQMIRMKVHNVLEVGFVLANYGCLRVPVPSLHKYLKTADTSDHEDGTAKHFHLNISAKKQPQLMQNANVIDVPTTWHRFTGRTEPSEPAGNRPHDPSDMPDWFRKMG